MYNAFAFKKAAISGYLVAFSVEVSETMKAVLIQLYDPIRSIKSQPYQFIVWWLVANVLGLAGIWLPLIILYFSERPVYVAFQNIVNAGSLASFCVVILAEGVASNLVARKTGSSVTAVGIRALFSIIAFTLALIPVGVLIAQHVSTDGPNVSISFQVSFTVLIILLASYLYCFRFPAWGERDVDYIRNKEDKDVRDLAEKAESQKMDDAGVKL